MKLKLIALITGIALALGLVHAGSISAQTPGPGVFPALDSIELSQQQQTELTDLTRSTLTQVESILTNDQRQQLAQAWTERNLMGAIANLNLTPQQRDELRQILQSARTEFSTILTPEQQQQLRRNIRARIQAP